ncbi:hypothetical protein GCM10007390_47860 [Persicitalea jodogahamensis]|uniref:Uncharacterized protein n=2 Tax=Persicitalea jodogahamensis TaxID=402147 RepID=A0A8J3GCT1_9BACT|nr:hypothetical protein GCM10007390_47860 [Persicitalea jodogahamensis]
MCRNLLRVAERQQGQQIDRPYDPYADGDLLGVQSYLYLLTGDQSWAERAWVSAERVLSDSTYFNSPLSRGLTRARLLQKMALAYDFCYSAWTEQQRSQANERLFGVMFSVNANMGHEANYAIESNWMGVRYGSVILASYVWDHDGVSPERSPALPLRWDANKRLQDHLEKVIFANGWNGESMSYHVYGWTFIGPALLALKKNIKGFDMADFVPETVNTLQGLMTSTVAIEHKAGVSGIQADLSDDDLMFTTDGLLGMAFNLYPADQQAALKWMHDYLLQTKNDATNDDGQLFYSMLYYPDTLEKQNPAQIGWLTYHDPDQGVVITRNRFRDENDIVVTYNAKATEIKGHAGADINTFRIIGMGVPWVIGSGRTDLTAGQTNLFPNLEETAEKNNRRLGKLHDYQFFKDGQGGYAIGSGSCVGTEDHRRILYTSFDSTSQAEAVIVVVDHSSNGRRWRINTPEFTQLVTNPQGYTLFAPNGSSMRVQFMGTSGPVQLESSKLPYGGHTTRHNNGIWYQGEVYSHSRYIDFYCQGSVTAVITLQSAGKSHPRAILGKSGSIISIADLQLTLPTHPED